MRFSQLRLIFERQAQHALLLVALLIGVYFAETRWISVRAGTLWGIDTPVWLWLAVLTPILHQLHVWFCWRMELHTKLLSRTLGAAGFPSYAVVFSILGIARVVFVFLLAISNEGSFDSYTTAMRVLAVVMALPAAYLFCSVARYFGFRRAFGIDHFDPSYRSLPMVREGIFRYTSNGMYVFGFFLIWLPGLWWASSAALLVALFQYLYIWVHFYFTELPDIRRIYGDASAHSESTIHQV